MEIDLNHLTESERDVILSVLSRNDKLRQRDTERIRTLKAELKQIRLKGVIKAGQNAEKTCARCRGSFGWFANKGSLCPKCQHKVCDNCQKPTKNNQWLCALCHKQMEYDAMSNDWFNSKHRRSKRNPKTNEVVTGSELVRNSIRRTDTDSDSTSNSEGNDRRAGSDLDVSYDADTSQHSSLDSITYLARYNRQYASQGLGGHQHLDNELDYLVELNTTDNAIPEDNTPRGSLSSSSSSSSLVLHNNSVCSSESEVSNSKSMSSGSDTPPIRSKVDILLARFGHKPRDQSWRVANTSEEDTPVFRDQVSAEPDAVSSRGRTLPTIQLPDEGTVDSFAVSSSDWSNKVDNAKDDLEWDNMAGEKTVDVTDLSIDRSRLYVRKEVTDFSSQSRHAQEMNDLRSAILSISPTANMMEDDDDDDSLSVISERTEPDSDDDDEEEEDDEKDDDDHDSADNDAVREEHASDFSVDSDVYISTDEDRKDSLQGDKDKTETENTVQYTEHMDTAASREASENQDNVPPITAKSSRRDVFDTDACSVTDTDVPSSEQKQERPNGNIHDTPPSAEFLTIEENTEIQAIADLDTDKDLFPTRKRVPTSDLDDDLEDIVNQNKDFMSDEELEDIMKDITRSKIAKLRAESEENVNVCEDQGDMSTMQKLHGTSPLIDDMAEEAFMNSLSCKRVSFSDVTIIPTDQVVQPEDGEIPLPLQNDGSRLNTIPSSGNRVEVPSKPDSGAEKTSGSEVVQLKPTLDSYEFVSDAASPTTQPPTAASVGSLGILENGDVVHESFEVIVGSENQVNRPQEKNEHPSQKDEPKGDVSGDIKVAEAGDDEAKTLKQVRPEDEIIVVEHIEEAPTVSKKEEKELKAAAKKKEKEAKEAEKKVQKEKDEAAKKLVKDEKAAAKKLQKETKLAAKAKEKEEKEALKQKGKEEDMSKKKNKTENETAEVASGSCPADGTVNSKDDGQTPIASQSLGVEKVVDEVSLTEDQLDMPRALPAIVTTKDTPSKSSTTSYTTAQEDRASRTSASSEKDDNIEELFSAHSLSNRTNLLSPYSISKESLASYYSDAGEVNYGKIAVKGDIKFGLDYNYKASCLEITVCECRELAAVDTKKKRSDPYVKAYLLPDKSKSGKRKTRVKKNTLDPHFNEVIKFHVPKSELETRTLWVAVWNNDVLGRNDFLGEVTISLDYYHFTSPEPKWYQLQPRVAPTAFPALTYKGDLDVSVKFVTPGNVTSGKSKKGKGGRGELQVLVKNAQNLTAVRSNGTSNPFCKGYLLPDKATKVKTPVLKHTCNPEWNHTFVFEGLIEDRLADFCLELTIWDHDRLTSNDFLGGVRISLGNERRAKNDNASGVSQNKEADWMDSQGREIELWRNVLARPDQWVDASLPLRTNMTSSRK